MKAKTLKKTLPKKNDETFGLYFLGAFCGLSLFKIYFTHFITTTFYSAYVPLYVKGMIISVSAGILSAAIMKLIREKWFATQSGFYPTLALFNFIFTLFVFHPSQGLKPGSLVYFLGLQLLGFILVKISDQMGLSKKGNLLYASMILLGLWWYSNLFPGWFHLNDWHGYNYLFFITIVSVFYFGIPPAALATETLQPFWTVLGVHVRKNILLYFLAFGLIAFSINTMFNYEPFHYTFYLGPLTDLIAGKSLLVNINAQYGVLVFYFLRFFFYFLPLGFVSLSIVLALLTLVQYLLFYFVARKLFSSELFAFFALVAVLLVNHFAQQNNGILFPSVGPLRFGFIYVLMALIVLRNQYPLKRNLFLILESAVVAIAFFWSLEVCAFTVVAYLGCVFYESIDFKNVVKFKLAFFLRRILLLVGCVFVVGLFLYADVFRRTGEWPHWPYYFDFVLTYQTSYNMLQVPTMDYWWVCVGIYFFSLFCILGISLGAIKNPPSHLNAILLLTLYGIFQLTYYFSRADITNLCHVSMPSVLLLIYWLYFIRHFETPSVPWVVKKVGFGAAVMVAAFYLQKTTPITLQKIQSQPTSLSVMLNRIYTNLFIQCHSVDPTVQQIDRLMEKYSGHARSLVYFLGEMGVDVAMATGRSNLYPYNDVIQPTVSKLAMGRINAFDPLLKPGDYIYTSNPDDFEKQLFEKLSSRFNLELVEKENSIFVYKIAGGRNS